MVAKLGGFGLLAAAASLGLYRVARAIEQTEIELETSAENRETAAMEDLTRLNSTFDTRLQGLNRTAKDFCNSREDLDRTSREFEGILQDFTECCARLLFLWIVSATSCLLALTLGLFVLAIRLLQQTGGQTWGDKLVHNLTSALLAGRSKGKISSELGQCMATPQT